MLGVTTIKTLTVRLEDDVHMAFKIYSAKVRKDMQDILRDHIDELLKSDSQKEQK